MIRQAQKQCGDAEALQAGAERIMLWEFRIPMRKNHDGLVGGTTGREPKPLYRIVLWVRRRNGRHKSEPIITQFEPIGLIVREEFLARRDDALIQVDQVLDRV